MDASRKTNFTRRILLVVTAFCSGGTVFGGCETRIKDAVVGGSKDFIGVILTSPATTNALLMQFGLVPEDNVNENPDGNAVE